MLFENTWSKITSWFRDRSERAKLINGFNEMARAAFVSGAAPTILRASSSRGYSKYKHEFSSWLSSGFRIQVLSGRQLTKEEIVSIGDFILKDNTLVRRLIVLGWDTLEIHDNISHYGCQWQLTSYAKVGLYLN